MKKTCKILISSTLVIIACVIISFSAFASPSITSVHGEKESTNVSPASDDGTNTASILSKESIYTNQAVEKQYMVKDSDGNLSDTPLSSVIMLAAGKITETDANGKQIPDGITSVKQLIETYCQSAKVEKPSAVDVDLEKLDQLTYWLDFKYESTDYRVIAGEEKALDDKKVALDNGMTETEIAGGEILRSGRIEDFVIIQIDATTGEVHYLKMKEYDEKTGKYVVQFPCIGPYMVTQIIR